MEKLNSLFLMVHRFLMVFLTEEKKCSPNTVRSYRKALELLFDYVKEQHGVSLGKVTFDMIDRELMIDFLNYLEQNRGCSTVTRNHRLECIRAFYKYAAQEDIALVTYYDEIQKVKVAKVPETIVEHMSTNAIQSILSQPDTSTDRGKRDAFLMLFLYKTGARVQELVDVRICDIQLSDTPRVLLHGKGAKSRAIPLRDDVVQHLKKYLALFHESESQYSDQYLFYSVRNQKKKRMTEQNVRSIVSKYGSMARETNKEVPEQVHPHLFRHSWAMFLYQNGVDLTLISQWLGHAQFKTTLIYAHADTEIKRKALEKAVPEDSPLKPYLDSERFQTSDEAYRRVIKSFFMENGLFTGLSHGTFDNSLFMIRPSALSPGRRSFHPKGGCKWTIQDL